MKSFKIKKNSLSYKWNSWLWWTLTDAEYSYKEYRESPDGMMTWVTVDDLPKDFCTYWRHTLIYSPAIALIWSFLILAFLSATYALIWSILNNPGDAAQPLMVLVVTFAGAFILIKWIVPYAIIPFVQWNWNTWLGKVMEILWWPFGKVFDFLGVLIFDIGVWVDKKFSRPKLISTKPKKSKQPSMFWQKLTAIKHKYCPMVEYETN